jgi:prepilin-type N-terminal cleavage/methylation domain-containing protein
MIEKKSGFTLIELLMVIAIIGILAAVALPLYKGHIIMAKLAEVENAISIIASGITAYYYDQNSWPNCPTIIEIGSSLGVSLGAITRVSSISIASANGTITATVQNINPIVDNKTLTLTPSTSSDGSISWNWGWSADFPPQFRPKNGR